METRLKVLYECYIFESNKWSAAGFIKELLFQEMYIIQGQRAKYINPWFMESIFTYTFIDMYMYTKSKLKSKWSTITTGKLG